jgi:hypothetical protein
MTRMNPGGKAGIGVFLHQQDISLVKALKILGSVRKIRIQIRMQLKSKPAVSFFNGVRPA